MSSTPLDGRGGADADAGDVDAGAGDAGAGAGHAGDAGGDRGRAEGGGRDAGDAATARIIALIPAHNEAPRIGPVIDVALRFLPVLVVDDGSTDDTATVARAAGATVLEQRPNQGKGAALRAGFCHALDDGADAILALDADGQHDPTEIPRFMAAIAPRAGADPPPDLVIGRRNFRTMPPLRRLSNSIGGLAFSWAVGLDIPDNQSGYRLLSRRLAEATLRSEEHGFAFEVEEITTCIRMRGSIVWLPIRTIYAGEPSHIRPLAHVREFLRIVRAARRDVRRPLG